MQERIRDKQMTWERFESGKSKEERILGTDYGMKC